MELAIVTALFVEVTGKALDTDGFVITAGGRIKTDTKKLACIGKDITKGSATFKRIFSSKR